MKKLAKVIILTAAILGTSTIANAQKLVLLHTNDTHSYIDPSEDGDAGALRRNVLIDSIRAAEPNVVLIDAGDAVQGTLYYHIYKGEVEHMMKNALGYDIAIMGNHELDNGVENLARCVKNDKYTWLSTNYDLSDSPLAPYFKRYIIKEIEGKKVGFIGININPKGLISDGNYNGIVYQDMFEAANATAWHLKHNEGVDKVIAITHIGYNETSGAGDIDLAKKSKDIDVIIGGHSHSLIDPSSAKSEGPWKVANANGDSIAVVQARKWGKYLGEVTIDLSNGDLTYQLLPVTARLDAKIDPKWDEIIAPYRKGVDSLMTKPIGKIPQRMEQNSPELLNYVTDIIKLRGDQINGKPVDLAIGNKGGIRCALPKGKVSEGWIINMLPFTNKITILDISGKDLKEAFDVMASRGGDGVSKEVKAKIVDGKAESTTINGKAIDPNRTYRIATIDYLANGGDYMTPLTKGAIIAKSDDLLYQDVIDYIKNTPKGKLVKIDKTERMSK